MESVQKSQWAFPGRSGRAGLILSPEQIFSKNICGDTRTVLICADTRVSLHFTRDTGTSVGENRHEVMESEALAAPPKNWRKLGAAEGSPPVQMSLGWCTNESVHRRDEAPTLLLALALLW